MRVMEGTSKGSHNIGGGPLVDFGEFVVLLLSFGFFFNLNSLYNKTIRKLFQYLWTEIKLV